MAANIRSANYSICKSAQIMTTQNKYLFPALVGCSHHNAFVGLRRGEKGGSSRTRCGSRAGGAEGCLDHQGMGGHAQWQDQRPDSCASCGYLMKQTYQNGAYVKKGTPMFQLDPRTFQAALGIT